MASKEDRLLAVSAALTLACLAIYFGVFLPPALKDSGPASVAIGFDLHSCFLPRFVYGSRELFHGRLPLWNPYEYGGVPFLATAQPAVFYPPKAILFAIFDENVAYWLFMGLHYLALGAGFLLFAREQRISGAAAFVGAAAWTFSLPMLLSNYHPTRIANLAPIPFCLVFVERIGRGVDVKRSAAWLVALLALQLTAGYPETTIDFGLIVAVHATMRFVTKEWRTPPWKSIGLFAALWIFAAVVAAVQLVPMVEAALFANRTAVADTISDPTITLGASLKPFIPGFFAFVLLAALDRRALPAVVCALLGIVLFQGGWLLLRRLPGFSMIRFPYVWIFITPFYLAWASALGADGFLRLESDDRRDRSRTFGARAVIVGWALYCLITWRRYRAGTDPTSVLATIIGSADGAALGVAGSLGLLALTVPKIRTKAGTAGAFAVFTLLTVSHQAGFPFRSTTAQIHRPTETGIVRRFMPNATRGRSLSLEDAMYGYELTDEIPSLLGAEESLVSWRYRQVLRSFKYEPAIGGLDWVPILSAPGFMNAMNVEFVAAPKKFTNLLRWFGFSVVTEQDDIVLFRQPRPLGNAWINYAAHFIPTEADARSYVLGKLFDPSREVVVEEPLTQKYPPSSPIPPGLPKSEKRPSHNEVEFAVDLPMPGVLVSSESFYPGWHVFVDGEPRPLLLVDYVLRGVEVAAGAHVVRFEYRPKSVRWGGIATVLGLMGLGALFVRSRYAPAPSGMSSGP